MKAFTRRLLALATLALLTLNARASTYLLLSQTNTFAAGITNAAKSYADTKLALSATNAFAAGITNEAKSYTDAHVTAGALTNNATTAAGELVKFTSTDKVSTAPASSADIQAAIGAGVYGNVESTGASTAGQFPTYTGIDGKSVVPTNGVPLLNVGTLTFTGGAANKAAVFDGSTNLVPSSATTNDLNAIAGKATTLGHYLGTDTNALLAAIGGLPLTGGTLSGTLGFSGAGTLLNLPSLTTAQKNTATAVAGSQVYDSDLGRVQAYDGSAWHSRVRLDGDTMTGSLTVTNAGGVPLTLNGGGNNNLLAIAGGGTNAITIDKNGNWTVGSPGSTVVAISLPGSSGSSIGGPNSKLTFGNGDASLTSAQLTIGAAPTDTQLCGGNAAAGTDHAGARMAIRSGLPTGNAAGGALDLNTAVSSETSGSTLRGTDSPRFHAKAKWVTLTHGSATTIETFSLAANKVIGGQMVVTVYATNSTPHFQAITSSFNFAAGAIGTTITGTVSTPTSTAQAADSGTLTLTGYTLLDNGNNTFSIQANVSSDLSSPTERALVVVTALNGTAVVAITDP